MANEKRQTQRVQPFVSPCRILDGERWFDAYLTDLSALGAQASSDSDAPAPGSTVILEVRLKGSLSASRLGAEVKWARGPEAGRGPSFGLTFGGLTKDQLKQLESVLDEFRRRAAELA